MRKGIMYLVFLFLGAILVAACHPFGTSNLETPSPLTQYTPTATLTQLWSHSVGDGTNQLGLRFTIGYANGTLYTTDAKGKVIALDAKTGKQQWSANVGNQMLAPAQVSDSIVVLKTIADKLIALDAKS